MSTIESPEKSPKNFSMLVDYSVYVTLRKMAVTADTNLGALCRSLLGIMSHPLYQRLRSQAIKENVSFEVFCRQILEDGLKNRQK